MNLSTLDFYRQFGPYSDPGEFVEMMSVLPQSLTELCELIKRQLIHPSQLAEYRKLLPRGAKNEDARFVTVAQMLTALKQRNKAGLTLKRPPRQRLIVSCRYHALLLAAILKSQGRPARVRVGFAGYLTIQKGKFVDHWICEVWSEAEQRWLLVDPDVRLVDFPRDDFKFAGNVWLAARKGFTSPTLFGVGRWWGWEPIRQNVIHDFEACLNLEPTYWEGPPLFQITKRKLNKRQFALLDKMAELLQDPDKNLADLEQLREAHKMLQREKLVYATTAVAAATPPQRLTSQTGIGPVCLEPARPEDAKALALVSWKAFDNDIHFGAPAKGGPPGYKSDRWQTQMMQAGDYYKVVGEHGRVLGGAIIFRQADGAITLGRIFIHPDVQHQGVGAAVIHLLETAHPDATLWRLDTPAWNKRNHAFYQKMGYKIVGKSGQDGILFEKKLKAA